jgi:glycosyltransferase involved in cell wall biosynthesis
MFLFTYRLYTILGKELGRFAPDLLIASSTYPLDNFSVKILAKKFKTRYCYEVHDLWPLSPMELGGYSKYHPFIVMMQWAESFAYRNADFVISMLPKTFDHMVSHGLKPEKFKYIPNGIAIDDWNEQQVAEEHVQAIEKLKVGYVGGHAISNALNYLLEAATLAVVKAPNLRFVLVGNGTEKSQLESLAKTLNNVLFLPPVSKKTVPSLLKAMDILYLGWHRNPLYRFGISPNKLMDYMMAAKPIVHSVEAANDIVKEADCGLSVKPENPESIVDALVSISNKDEFQRIEMGKKGKDFVIKHYNYEKLAEDFITFAQRTTLN